MKIEGISSVKGNTDGDFDTNNLGAAGTGSHPVTPIVLQAQPSVAGKSPESDSREEMAEGKEPSKTTIDSVVSEANQKMRMTKTRCEYSYDEPTKRVSIKVYDKATDQLIREVPPEKSLEMLQKMWELAGIMVDEKR